MCFGASEHYFKINEACEIRWRKIASLWWSLPSLKPPHASHHWVLNFFLTLVLLLLDSAASCLAPPPSFTPIDPFALHTDPIPVHRARSFAPHKFFQRFARKSNFIIVEVSDISQLGNSLIPLAFPLSLRFCLKWFRFVLCLLPVSLAFSAIVPALSLLACTFPQGSVTLTSFGVS